MTGTTVATEQPAPVRMMRLLYSAVLANLVSAVAEHGVADLLADGPRPVEELAARSGTHPDALYRVLRTLAAGSVFTEVAPRCFGLTPLADTLRSSVPGSMREHARNWGSPEYQRAFAELPNSLRTGRPGFEHAYGTDWWSYLAANPTRGEGFDRAMADRVRGIVAAALDAVDLTGVRRLVDVGGGHGQLVTALLARDPELTAVVFDRPEVVAGAAKHLTEAGCADRAETLGGDFFASVPAGADAYLLSSILHDWADADAVAILRTVRRAMHPSSQVIVVETVLPDGDTPHVGKLLDAIMLALVGGRERTESEFAALLARAGLRHVRTVPTASPVSVLVAAA